MKKSMVGVQDIPVPVDDSFLSGNGEIVALIRTLDWSATPLGPIEGWPQSLRTTVNICLASNFPICIVWGPGHTQIYNEGYRVICGEKHPLSMGSAYPECWKDAWPAIGRSFDNAISGVTSFLENQRMFLHRNGYLEETFFTFSLSPIRDEAGGIGGLFHPVTETTTTMVGERRTRALLDLTASLADAEKTSEVFQRTIETLAGFGSDLPFVLLYKLDKEARVYRLAGCTGIDRDSGISPDVLALDSAGVWPMECLLRQATSEQISGIQARIGAAACGPYEEAPDVAFAVSIFHPGVDLPVALLMAGASPRLPLDPVYRGFYDVLGAVFRAALGRATVVEEERRNQEMLAALDRAKTVFFSNISHEFRTPLTLMLGPLEDALATQDLPAAQRERLEIANRNAKRLLKLVNSLLEFSRNEAGRNQASFVKTDLSALVIDLASNFQSACLQAGLELVVECPPLREPVFIDREMWEKIVLNLMSNAFKFTLQGRIRVSLREHGGRIELEVADTGVGIPAEEVPRIFDRFYRVEVQSGRSMEGSGIGLSLVRELVQLHGGTIDAASAPGQGTVFTLRMPSGSGHLPAGQVHDGSDAPAPAGQAEVYVEEALHWLPVTQAQAAAEQPDDMPLPSPVADRPRIVLADDNADMRVYIQRILEKSGYDVDVAENGVAALAAIQHGRLPELLLTDVMMPMMDGFSLLHALRSDEATKGMVIILLSARAGEEARLEGLAAGADDYLIKPFGARELQARVDGAITLARQRREASAREHSLLTEIETERSRSALRESQAHVASLFEQTTAGIAELDLAGHLSRVNDRYCQIIGRTREQLIGHPFHAFIYPEDLEENVQLFNRMVDTGQPFEVDNRYQHPDGTVVWVSKAVNPIKINGDPSLVSVMAVVLDITERKKAEEEVRDASQRKDEFLAMLAHELRNPLAPISAAAQLIGMTRLNEERLKQMSGVITRQVRHMTNLVDDLLDVSRVTRGLVSISKSVHEIKELVANALEQVQPLFQARNQRLVVNLATEKVNVLADEKRLVQILTNLLNNASKFTPAGGVIELRTEAHDKHIDLVVQDNGIGMTPELQLRVFDLFAQAERTPDRSQGGLGLGLALVKTLVNLHGGEVSCASEGLDKGSVFVVTLPRITDSCGESGSPQTDQTLVKSAHKLRILLVDDNVDVAQMLAMLLEEIGYEVLVEFGSIKALARARSQAPDVCILDIGLPEMNGHELARRLRAAPETANAILIAVTGYGQEKDRTDALDSGFNHHFVKPVDMEKLIALLNEITAAKKARDLSA
jgi:PAS domain S-box-containing protein